MRLGNTVGNENDTRIERSGFVSAKVFQQLRRQRREPAVVIKRTSDGGVAAAGGFVVATPTATPVATAPSAGGTGTSAVATGGDGSAPRATMTIAGIGPIDPATVDEIFWTTYAAGEISPVAVRVHFVILKAAR